MTRPPLPDVIGLETWPESPEARRERDEARAAIAADLHCDECHEVATRHHHEPARKHGGDDCACDTHSAENSDGYWVDLPHAAAVRAAQVTP